MQIYQVREKLRGGTSIFDLDLKVGYYARVSTEKDEQKLSIDNQQEYFEDFIASHPRWTLVGRYVDDGKSGIHTEKREAFQNMINDSSMGKVDLILTKEISRFARNTLDSIQWTRKLLCYGTCVWFLNDNINTIDMDSEFRLTIMAGIAQDEVRKLSARVSFGQAQSIKKGRAMGSNNMYGYKKEDCKYTVIKEEAKMVKEIFELYSSGKWSTSSLETFLYEKGYRTRKGKKILSRTIASIITNPKYKGYYCGGKVKIIDMFTKKQEFIPEDQWIMYKDEANVPAIVSEELWDKANDIYKSRSSIVKSKRTSFKNDNNIFTGKIICGVDGETYWLKSRSLRGKPDKKWRCNYKIKNGAESCPSFSIDEEELKFMISNIINSLLENFDDIYSEYIEIYRKTQLSSLNDNEKDILDIKEKIEDLNKKKEKLLDGYLNEIIEQSDFKNKNKYFNEQLKDFQKRLDDLQSVSNCNNQEEDDRLDVLRMSLKNFLGVTPKEIDKKIVDEIIEKIIITPNDEHSANVVFYLSNNTDIAQIYDRNDVAKHKKEMCRSVSTSFIILPEQHIGFTRNLRSCVGHTFKINYHYSVIL